MSAWGERENWAGLKADCIVLTGGDDYLREAFVRFAEAAWNRIVLGEAKYREAWRQRDNLAEAQEESLDGGNYEFFAWLQREERRAKA
jgi:hypothetical protein